MIRVSILTPSHNDTDDAFERSLDSVDRQTCKDFEWIIVDDGSKHPTHYVTAALGYNYGPSVARNVAFQLSTGDIITYLDLGDELYHDRVEKLINLYDNYRVEMSFCGYDIIQGKKIQRFNPFSWIGDTMSAIDYISLLQKQNISVPLGVAHRRKPFVEAGGFQRGIVCGEDGVLWRRMVNRISPERIAFSEEFAGRYHVSQEGQSRTQRRFDMGAFALDGSREDNGRYLDESWFENFSSGGFYE